jgi:uncharacterized membrane protein
MIALGTLPGAAPGCAPRDLNLNNLGQVVGWFSEPGGICTGFLLNPVEVTPGVWQWFQDDGTGANALMLGLGNFAPSSINNLGQIIGTLADRATLRQPDGTLVDLGGGALPSWGEDINNAGQISLSFNIGSPGGRPGLLTPLDTNSDGTPDLWNRDLNGDGFNDLIVDLGGAKNLQASVVVVHGLNDIGSVLGNSANDNAGMTCMRRAGFLWENGVAKTLDSLTGNAGEFHWPAAINNARQILSDGYILLPTP